MSLRGLLRFFLWSVVAGFLIDVLRRCWIVEAWSIAPVAALALLFTVRRLAVAFRDVRRRRRIDFIRPARPRRAIR